MELFVITGNYTKLRAHVDPGLRKQILELLKLLESSVFVLSIFGMLGIIGMRNVEPGFIEKCCRANCRTRAHWVGGGTRGGKAGGEYARTNVIKK